MPKLGKRETTALNKILKTVPKTEFMLSPRSGKEVTNQIKIYGPNYLIFKSYKSNIVIIVQKDGKETIYLDADKWNYSKTTGIYRNIFLREGIQETRNKIESGVYKLADLNG